MIGKLTIDKSSKNLSFFLFSIVLLGRHGGRLSRQEFVSAMASFVGVSSQNESGNENRSAYNKSKLPRYYGFIGITREDNTEYLELTNRGRDLIKYIVENPDAEAKERFSIAEQHKHDFAELIFESIQFDSFGHNNCGAENSKSDVEPPKALFRMLYDLKSVTSDEFCYLIFGIDRGIFSGYEEALNFFKEKRSEGIYTYKDILTQLNLVNIAADCKLIEFFALDAINLLTTSVKENVEFFRISDWVLEKYEKQISKLNPIYSPLRLFVSFSEDSKYSLDATLNVVLGRISSKSDVFVSETKPLIDFNSPGDSLLFDALLAAFQNPSKNIYLVVKAKDEAAFNAKFGKFMPLFKPLFSVSAPDNGASLNSVTDALYYQSLIEKSKEARKFLRAEEVRFPSNFQVIGVLNMDSANPNFEFVHCIIKNVENHASENNLDSCSRIQGGQNVILYGVPGSGKSYAIKHQYCDDETKMVRVVFHPDYTYSDFVGQILPVISGENDEGEGRIIYKFVPGPFTQILKKAYENPESMFFLVIEEINRGNAPAIFGDIFQLLDRSVEGKNTGESEYGITNSDIAEIVYGDPYHMVRIPSNLSIICTMNTSDQNVFTLDTAFQRRWNMRLVPNKFSDSDLKFGETKILDTRVSWKTFCERINDIILTKNVRLTSSEDKRLGTHFVTESDLKYIEPSDLHGKELSDAVLSNRRFPEKVIKYLWDDAFKFNREEIFDINKFNSLESVIDKFVSCHGNDRFLIFVETVRNDLLSGDDSDSKE